MGDKCRDIEISKKRSSWEERQKKGIVEMVSASQDATRSREESLRSAKESKCEAMRDAAQKRAESRTNDLNMNAKREEKIREKELARKMKEAERTQRVKNDITAQKGAKV